MAKIINIKEEKQKIENINLIKEAEQYLYNDDAEEYSKEMSDYRRKVELSWIKKYNIADTDKEIYIQGVRIRQ